MATQDKVRWQIEPHTRAKHLILRRYLDAWLPVMASVSGRVSFIDGFAGPGRYSGGEEGSPLIALRALLDHPHFQKSKYQRQFEFTFVERDGARATALNQELVDFGKDHPIPSWVRVEVIHGDFAEIMTERLDRLAAHRQQLPPTFAFIDPFGFSGIPLALIARIGRSPRCECLINLMYESINRFIGHPEESIRRHFDAAFGTAEWRSIISETEPDIRAAKITELYRQQLIRAGNLKFIRTFEMINQGNRTEYFLFFATNSPTGLSKMKEAMWRADPVAGEAFSDRTETGQMVLIQPSADLRQLKQLVRTRFRDRSWVSVEQVQKFVLFDTPFSETMHLKQKTLKILEQDIPAAIEVRRPQGKRNRPGEYPPGTQIRFL